MAALSKTPACLETYSGGKHQQTKTNGSAVPACYLEVYRVETTPTADPKKTNVPLTDAWCLDIYSGASTNR